jgi:hypothetical protein
MTPVAADGDDSLVEDTDLPYMVLPVADLGDEFSDFRIEAFGGFDPEEDRIPNEIAAYIAFYDDPTSGGLLRGRYTATGATVFRDAGSASSSISDAIEMIRDLFGDRGAVETFEVSDIGDEALGVTLSIQIEDLLLQETAVLFRIGRLVGATAIGRDGVADDQDQAVTMARTLLERMQGVIKGDVTDLPGVLPPDVNCNGVLNAIDATLLLQLSAALISTLRCDFLADANGDGRVDAVDATLILQFDAGLIFQFVSN